MYIPLPFLKTRWFYCVTISLHSTWPISAFCNPHLCSKRYTTCTSP